MNSAFRKAQACGVGLLDCHIDLGSLADIDVGGEGVGNVILTEADWVPGRISDETRSADVNAISGNLLSCFTRR